MFLDVIRASQNLATERGKISRHTTLLNILPKTFYPSSVPTYSSNSNSVIRLHLTGGVNEWINLRILLIGFTLINADNDGTKELRPAYKPSSFFQRMRVMAGSNVIAEIPDLSRYEAMVDILQDCSGNYTNIIFI